MFSQSPSRLRAELPDHAVHLWLLPETFVREACERLAHVLTDDEVRRALRYRQQQDGDRFVARRSVLRAILGGYLRRDPAALRFTAGEGGKPMLIDRDSPAVCFSVSQTNGLAAIACVRDHEPGVDVERRIQPGETLRIGGDILSDVEQDSLSRHTDSKDARLLRVWTRKEALLKAVGTGLSGTSSAWSVIDGSEPDPRCWRAFHLGHEVTGWTLMDVDAGDAFTAALAVPTKGVSISVIVWDGSHAVRPGASF